MRVHLQHHLTSHLIEELKSQQFLDLLQEPKSQVAIEPVRKRRRGIRINFEEKGTKIITCQGRRWKVITDADWLLFGQLPTNE